MLLVFWHWQRLTHAITHYPPKSDTTCSAVSLRQLSYLLYSVFIGFAGEIDSSGHCQHSRVLANRLTASLMLISGFTYVCMICSNCVLYWDKLLSLQVYNKAAYNYVVVTGRRSCLGELLAQQKIYLFLAAVVQNFIIKPPEGCDEIVCGEKVSVTVAPEHFNVRFIPRSCDWLFTSL